MSEKTKVEDINRNIYDIKNVDDYDFKMQKGLNREIVTEISKMKNEPEWMLKIRLDALEMYNKLELPTWGPDLSELNMDDTIKQVEAFDQSVDYVLAWAEKHPGTLVLVTADHETGGVKIPKNATAKDINNDCFTSGGDHTNTNVLLMADGASSKEICKNKLIDNTDIAKYMRKVLSYKLK